ncbi:MAG: hypothetical protein U0Q12_13890 [Vicinamibacterales bacterium]
MTHTHRLLTLAMASLLLTGTMAARASSQAARRAPAASTPTTDTARLERGEYLVRVAACHDCHTPFAMGPNGPAPDMTRALSGHPQELVMPPAPPAVGPWIGHVGATNTAWAGPWGVSFSANLTPDPETGLGSWTEEMFLATVRTGRHQGKGRAILPPMVIPALQAATDEDLKSIFRYLQTVRPIRNKVPAPIEPAE